MRMVLSDSPSFFLVASEETEAHIHEAFRLSPRDIFAYRWIMFVGVAKLQRGADAEAVGWLRRGLEANRNFPIAHFISLPAWRSSGTWTRRGPPSKRDLRSTQTFTIRRYRVSAPSSNPIYLAGRERFYQGMRMAGVPEG